LSVHLDIHKIYGWGRRAGGLRRSAHRVGADGSEWVKNSRIPDYERAPGGGKAIL
jgi:hypothetical protein